ncbi:MAG: hypothetical protein RR248_05795 [Clostridia bacterium]
MEDLQNNIKDFVYRANDLIQSKMILADKAITNMLRCIADIKPLLDCAMQSLADTTYAVEFLRAKESVVLPDGTKHNKIKPPINPIRLFAFVVCLLTEFDSARRNLSDFLNEYYANEDVNISYSQFATQFLKPFKKAGEDILNSTNPDTLNLEEQDIATKYFEVENIYINTTALIEMTQQLDRLSQKLNTETYFCQQDKQDCLEITLSLKNALLCKNPKLIKLMWIAFKNTLCIVKSSEAYIKKVNVLLIESNLI